MGHGDLVNPARRWLAAILTGAALFQTVSAAEPRWSRGPSEDPGDFPIAVWLQDPRNAARYKELGINVYVGLWKGPTPSSWRR